MISYCSRKYHHYLWTRAHPSDGDHYPRLVVVVTMTTVPAALVLQSVDDIMLLEPVEPVQDLTSLSLGRQAGAG